MRIGRLGALTGEHARVQAEVEAPELRVFGGDPWTQHPHEMHPTSQASEEQAWDVAPNSRSRDASSMAEYPMYLLFQSLGVKVERAAGLGCSHGELVYLYGHAFWLLAP